MHFPICDDNDGGGAATAYKVGNKCIFMNQATSYVNRGNNFDAYGQLEFECIVEIQTRKSGQKKRGRLQRIGFDLGKDHPLFLILACYRHRADLL